MEDFKHLRVLFTIEERMEGKIDRRISAKDSAQVSHGEEGAESKGEALNLQSLSPPHGHEL